MSPDQSDPLLMLTESDPTVVCGKPPYILAKPGRYIDYFRADDDETQGIFVFDYGTYAGMLHTIQNGWMCPLVVRSGSVSDVILGQQETLWLQLCWEAATGATAKARAIAAYMEFLKYAGSNPDFLRITLPSGRHGIV